MAYDRVMIRRASRSAAVSIAISVVATVAGAVVPMLLAAGPAPFAGAV